MQSPLQDEKHRPPSMAAGDFGDIYSFKKLLGGDPSRHASINLEYVTEEMPLRGNYRHAVATLSKAHLPLYFEKIDNFDASLLNPVRMISLEILNPPFVSEDRRPRRDLRGIRIRDVLAKLNNGNITEPRTIRNNDSVFLGKGPNLIWKELFSSLSKCTSTDPEDKANEMPRRQSKGACSSGDSRMAESHILGLYLAFNNSKESFRMPTDFVEDMPGLRAVYVNETITSDWAIVLILSTNEKTSTQRFDPKVYCPRFITLSADPHLNPAFASVLSRGGDPSDLQKQFTQTALRHLINYARHQTCCIEESEKGGSAFLLASASIDAGAAASGRAAGAAGAAPAKQSHGVPSRKRVSPHSRL
jgi:hypothetical protein